MSRFFIWLFMICIQLYFILSIEVVVMIQAVRIAFESTEKVTALASLHLRNMLTNEYVDVIAVGLAKTNKNGDTGRVLNVAFLSYLVVDLQL